MTVNFPNFSEKINVPFFMDEYNHKDRSGDRNLTGKNQDLDSVEIDRKLPLALLLRSVGKKI